MRILKPINQILADGGYMISINRSLFLNTFSAWCILSDSRHADVACQQSPRSAVDQPDPLANNTVYMCSGHRMTNSVIIIAKLYSAGMPEEGPNYATFGENIRYEIHIKTARMWECSAVRWTTSPTVSRSRRKTKTRTTFFNIRLGMPEPENHLLLAKKAPMAEWAGQPSSITAWCRRTTSGAFDRRRSRARHQLRSTRAKRNHHRNHRRNGILRTA